GRGGGGGRGGAGERADRPRARLRQDDATLAGGDPAARRDGRDRVAGAGVAVQQGLRRGDTRPAGGGAPDRDARRDGDRGLARGAGLPGASGRRDPAGGRHGRLDRGHAAAGAFGTGVGMTGPVLAPSVTGVVVVPSAPVLLPAHAGQVDAVPELRAAIRETLSGLPVGEVALLPEPRWGERVGRFLLADAGLGDPVAVSAARVLVVVGDGSARRTE